MRWWQPGLDRPRTAMLAAAVAIVVVLVATVVIVSERDVEAAPENTQSNFCRGLGATTTLKYTLGGGSTAEGGRIGWVEFTTDNLGDEVHVGLQQPGEAEPTNLRPKMEGEGTYTGRVDLDRPYSPGSVIFGEVHANGRVVCRSEMRLQGRLTAIEERHRSLGGQSGELGPRRSGEYAIGGGRAQDFARGKIYWSPSTRAHEVSGRLLDEYSSLGGASGGLGFPLAPEGAVANGRSQRFERGEIFSSPGNGTHGLHGDVLRKYTQFQGPTGPLGFPKSAERQVPGGIEVEFERGRIYWAPGIGAHVIRGGILSRYLSDLGGPGGPLGLPTSDEIEGPEGSARQTFARNSMVSWSPEGLWLVQGPIYAKYTELGGVNGWLGIPTSGEYDVGDGRRVNFRKGYITARTDGTVIEEPWR